MILIISQVDDKTTDSVVNWIKYRHGNVYRINSCDRITITRISFEPATEILFCINNRVLLNTRDVSAYWYRRGLKEDLIGKTTAFNGPEQLNKLLLKYQRENALVLMDFLFAILENTKNRIGSINNATNNKLLHLSIAKNLGLHVPSTLVCRHKNKLDAFTSGRSIISKSLSNGFFYEEEEPQNGLKNTYGLYANEVTERDLERAREPFATSLFQENILKRFELRIFYLRGQFFCMAIFSQQNKRTAIDFRKYDEERPNRTVPLNLPAAVQRKLRLFMKTVGLDCGSIDMIYGKDGRYYFLEVNPVGQFGMVSYPCNYKIERVVAEMLMQ